VHPTVSDGSMGTAEIFSEEVRAESSRRSQFLPQKLMAQDFSQAGGLQWTH
jgi:hypothetical protein